MNQESDGALYRCLLDFGLQHTKEISADTTLLFSACTRWMPPPDWTGAKGRKRDLMYSKANEKIAHD